MPGRRIVGKMDNNIISSILMQYQFPLQAFFEATENGLSKIDGGWKFRYEDNGTGVLDLDNYAYLGRSSKGRRNSGVGIRAVLFAMGIQPSYILITNTTEDESKSKAYRVFIERDETGQITSLVLMDEIPFGGDIKPRGRGVTLIAEFRDVSFPTSITESLEDAYLLPIYRGEKHRGGIEMYVNDMKLSSGVYLGRELPVKTEVGNGTALIIEKGTKPVTESNRYPSIFTQNRKRATYSTRINTPVVFEFPTYCDRVGVYNGPKNIDRTKPDYSMLGRGIIQWVRENNFFIDENAEDEDTERASDLGLGGDGERRKDIKHRKLRPGQEFPPIAEFSKDPNPPYALGFNRDTMLPVWFVYHPLYKFFTNTDLPKIERVHVRKALFRDRGAAIKELARLGHLSEAIWRELERIWKNIDSKLAKEVMDRTGYERGER